VRGGRWRPQRPFRVNITWVTPLGDATASIA
jgi:hypothetical protein